MKIKKILSIALALLMLVSLIPAAFAEGPDDGEDIEIVQTEESAGQEGVTPPTQPVGLNYGYYLIGRYGWTINDLDESRDKFEQNYASSTTEYKLMTTLEEGQQIKVVLVSNGTQLGPWYPDGEGNEYTVDAAHAGTKIIYFRPDYNSDWSAFGGYMWIDDPPTYHVNITQPLHGTLVPDKYDAAEGETITVTAYPDPGYYPAQPMKCSPYPSNTSWPDAYHFCFTMPAYDVTVSIGWNQMCVDEGFYYSVDINVMDLTPAQKFTAVSSAYGEYEYEAVLEEGKTLDLTRIITAQSWSSGYLRWDFSTETPWTEGDSPWLITAEKAGHAKIFLSSTNGDGYTKAFDYSQWTAGTSDMWLIVKYYQPITVLPTEHGTVTAPADAFEDDIVYLTVTPDEGYELDTLTVTDANGHELYLHGVNGTNFYMPATAATVSATFKQAVMYSVTLVGAREGVTITSTKETAKEGDTVDVNIRTDSYHRFVSITVTDEDGNEIETTKRPDGANKYRFTMPASDVTVTVVTKEIYPLYIINTQVDEFNRTDILGDGSASYDPATRTLSFSSATPNFGTDYGNALIYWTGEQSLTVEAPYGVDLAGNTTYCLYSTSGDVIINGDVILDIPDESNGIWCMKTLTINGNVSGTVKAIALYGLNGITVNGNVNITNQESIRTAYSIGTVSISGDFTTVGLGIDAMGGISIGGNVTITSTGKNEYGLMSGGGSITVGSGAWDITATSCPLKAAGGIVIPEDHLILLPEGGVLGTLTESGTNYTVVYEADGTTKATHVIIDVLRYQILIGSFEGGAVAADKESAAEGETVTLTVTPDEGCALSWLRYTTDGETWTDIAFDESAGSYHFAMPAADVTVSAAFEQLGHHIIVDDYTKGLATTSIDAGALYSGEVSFTVACDKVCGLALVNEDGTLTRLTCTTADGVHSYSVTVADEDVNLVIVFRGDADLDGSVEGKDATLIRQIVVGNNNLTEGKEALQIFAADLNFDGELQGKEATMIAMSVIGTRSYDW